MSEIGKKTWLVPDCYWPEITSPGHYVSHESICVLNTGKEDAAITITLYFEDREPITGYTTVCGAERTHHIRLDQLVNDSGKPVPKGVPYALLLQSTQPVVAQYSRLDTTQANEALMTCVAYGL